MAFSFSLPECKTIPYQKRQVLPDFTEILIHLYHLLDVEKNPCDLDELRRPMTSPIPSEFSLAVSSTEHFGIPTTQVYSSQIKHHAFQVPANSQLNFVARTLKRRELDEKEDISNAQGLLLRKYLCEKTVAWPINRKLKRNSVPAMYPQMCQM